MVAHRNDEPVRTALRGPVPLAQAARLLRLSMSDVEKAIDAGDLPSVEHRGIVHLDGPRLFASFATPAWEGPLHQLTQPASLEHYDAP